MRIHVVALGVASQRTIDFAGGRRKGGGPTAVSVSVVGITTLLATLLHGIDAGDDRWQLLGALEALNGWLLFGLTTAFLFAVIHKVWSSGKPSTSSSRPELSESEPVFSGCRRCRLRQGCAVVPLVIHPKPGTGSYFGTGGGKFFISFAMPFFRF